MVVNSKETIRIGILLPAYNAEPYIADALQSLLNQTYPHFDIWVFNDGSTDGTEAIIQTFTDSRVKLINNPKNLGLVATLNRGLDMICAYGGYTYIARMDADDTAQPERIAKQVSYMESNPNIVLSGTGMYACGNLRGYCVYPKSSLALRYAFIARASRFSHPTIIARISLFNDGSFRYNPNYPYAEDAKLWADIVPHYSTGNISDKLLNYNFNANNTSTLHAVRQKAIADKVFEEEFENILGRTLKQSEKSFVGQTFKKGQIEEYLDIYTSIITRIIHQDPSFTTNKECRQLVARLVARTLYVNRKHLSFKQAIRLIRTLLVKPMGISYANGLMRISKSALFIKALKYNNDL